MGALLQLAIELQCLAINGDEDARAALLEMGRDENLRPVPECPREPRSGRLVAATPPASDGEQTAARTV